MFIRKVVKKILVLLVPELRPIITGTLKLDTLSNIDINSSKSNFSKVIEPYRLIKTKIGDGTYVSLNSKISETTIGKYCSIGPNFLCGWGMHPTNALSTSPYFYSTLKQNGQTLADKDLFEERKPISIGNDVFIGANVTVLDGVNIGDGVIIGAGSVVSKDIPDYAIAFGNPIEIRKYRFTDSQREKLKEIKWWDFNEEKLKDVNTYFYDIDAFINKYEL